MLFNPERASRLLILKARDLNTQPGFTYVMSEIINETILKKRTDKNDNLNFSNVELEISKMVNHSVLNHLFMLANSKKTHQEVNARTYYAIKNIKRVLEEKDPEDYHYHYLSDKIEKFLSGKIDIQFPEELKPPDGSPIGSYGDLIFSCGSEL